MQYCVLWQRSKTPYCSDTSTILEAWAMNRRFLLVAISALIWILASNESYALCITFDDVQANSSRYTVDLDGDGSSDLIFTTPSPKGFTPSAPPVSLTGIIEPGLGGRVLSHKTGATAFETAEVIVEFLGGATDSVGFNFAVSGEIHSTWNAYIQLGTHEEGLISGRRVKAEKTLSERVPSGKIITVSEGFMEHSFTKKADFALINFNTTSGGLFILDNFVGTFGTAEDPVLEPAISVSPLNLDFGKAQVGTLSTPLELTVSSVGDADLQIEGLSISGQDASEFRMENDNCSYQVLLPGETSTVDVLFSPISDGPKNADLMIPSNVPGNPPVDVPLIGTGLTAPVWIDSVEIVDSQGEPSATFGKKDLLFITMNYTLSETLTRRYRVVTKITAFGVTAKDSRKRCSAGSYSATTSLMPGDVEPGAHKVVCTVKTIRKGKVIGRDTVTYYVIVTE